MSEQLRNATAPVHQSLEGFLIPIIKKTNTLAEYRMLLHMFYGFYKPLEESIERFRVQELIPDWPHRRKAGHILHDLHQLGDESTPALCHHLPDLEGEAHAMGALYVLEGSTLGGLIITKILRRNLEDAPETAFAFFNGYGDETALRWNKFREVLAPYADDPQQYTLVASAASQTFALLKRWAEQTYSHERTEEKL